MPAGEAIYLYGFVPAAARGPGAEVAGIADRPVELLDFGAFNAAVSRVPAREYDAAAIEARLRDLAWVADQGVRHERVVAWFVDSAQILPARLFSLHSSEHALAREVERRVDEIAAQLRRFAGVRQWDVKVSYDAARLATRLAEVSPEIAALDAEIAGAPPGRRFLLEKKRADVVKREAAAAARRLAAEALDALRPHAIEAAELPPPRSAAELPVLARAALLVAAAAEAPLREAAAAEAARLAALGITLEVTGPWAPYHFAGATHGGAAGAGA